MIRTIACATLVAGTLAQKRLTRLSPKAVDGEALARIFEDAMGA